MDETKKVELAPGLFLQKTESGEVHVWLEGPVGIDEVITQAQLAEAIAAVA